LPTLNKLAKEYQNKGLLILGINDQEPEEMEKFYKKEKLVYPTVTDQARAVRAHYTSTGGIPYTVFLDRKGRFVAESLGTMPEAEFRRVLKKAGLK
jgi:peroxiredoxin